MMKSEAGMGMVVGRRLKVLVEMYRFGELTG
jgi:hypothetical protein